MGEDVRPLIEIQDRSYDRAAPGLHESYPRDLAMDASRMAEFLGRKRYAVLATGRQDGRPHAAPIAFSVWGGAFWIATVEGTRLQNLRSRAYASMVVMEGDERAHHCAVIAEGSVILHEGVEIIASNPEFAELWNGRHGSAPTWAAAFIELRPRRIFSFDGTLEGR